MLMTFSGRFERRDGVEWLYLSFWKSSHFLKLSNFRIVVGHFGGGVLVVC